MRSKFKREPRLFRSHPVGVGEEKLTQEAGLRYFQFLLKLTLGSSSAGFDVCSFLRFTTGT